jgi:hypothetical protein
MPVAAAMRSTSADRFNATTPAHGNGGSCVGRRRGLATPEARDVRSLAPARSYGVIDDIDISSRCFRSFPPTAVAVIFDHNMGGGANLYRRNVIAERVAAGSAVLLCNYNLPTLDYRLSLLANDVPESQYRISSFLALEPLFERLPVAEVIVNSTVSFDDPLLFAEWTARTRKEHPSMRLTVTAHAFFAVCPSFVLLNFEGRYCGIPDLAECSRCLPRPRARYVALSPPTTIPAWRASWGRCLAAADEVRCFSGSTRTLPFGDSVPAIPRVLPLCRTVGFILPPAGLRHADPLVRVVGHISAALIVQDVLSRLERDHPASRIVVIGTLDLALKSSRLVGP